MTKSAWLYWMPGECLIDDHIQKLRNFHLNVAEWLARCGNDLKGGANVDKKVGKKKSAEDVLTMPHVALKDAEDIMMDVVNNTRATDHEDTPEWSPMQHSTASIYDTVEASVKYKSYVRKQYKDMES